jgi:hypothetical protein
MITYLHTFRTTLINTDTKDILMNISPHVKVYYLTILTHKVERLPMVDQGIIKGMWHTDVFYLMTQSTANIIQHQWQMNKTQYHITKIIQIKIKTQANYYNTKCKNVKSCCQTSCCIRYLLFLMECKPKVLTPHVYSMSDHSALNRWPKHVGAWKLALWSSCT